MRTCQACGATTERADARFCTGCGSPLPDLSSTSPASTRRIGDPFPETFISNGVRWNLHEIRTGKGVYRSSLGQAELSVAAVQSAASGESPLVQEPQEPVTSGDLIKSGCSLILVVPFLVIGLGLFPFIGGSYWGGTGVAVGLAIDALIVWAAWNVYRSRR